MDAAIKRKGFFSFFAKGQSRSKVVANLSDGYVNIEYTIKEIQTEDQSMKDFLFTLGCYEGEQVTIISRLADNFVISVKDARYSINTELAKVIIV